MDFSALLAELRDVAEKYRGKDAEPSISTVVYVDMFTKILKRVQKSVDDYEDQITVLWVTLNQLASIYKELSAGDPTNQLCRFIFGMCARTVLNIQWPQLEEDSEIKKNFCTTVENVHKILSEQGFPRFQLILDLMDSHWTHPILSQIMSAEDDVDGGDEYIQDQDPEILKLRVEIMMKENCEEFALNLCSWSLKHPALTDDLKIKEWQIVMLYRQNEYGKMQEVCESIVCHNGMKVMSHLAKVPSNQQLCIRLAQIFLIQDWIQSDRKCCTQELLKLWIHHQYLADKDEERFLESIWAVAKVSSTTEQIGVLIDGVRKECGEMFIQLYTDLCKFALNIDKGNVEQELQKGNIDEVKTRQLSIAKTCIRLAFLVKDYDFHIARVCGLSAFSLNPTSDSLNLVNKLYWTIKNTSATSGRCKINPATLYEIERLLDLMRPAMLKPELNWKQIIPLCKKYKTDREQILAEAGGVYVPVVRDSSEIAVKVENIKLEDPLNTGDGEAKQVDWNKYVADNKPSTNKITDYELETEKKQSSMSCDCKTPPTAKPVASQVKVPISTVQAVSPKPGTSDLGNTLGSQFPSNAFNDLKDGPELVKKDLGRTIQDLKQSLGREPQFREQFSHQLTNISSSTVKMSDAPKTLNTEDSSYLGQLKSDRIEQVASESLSWYQPPKSDATNIHKPVCADFSQKPPTAHLYQRQQSIPQSKTFGGSPPAAHSHSVTNAYPSCARSQPVDGTRPFSPPAVQPSKGYHSPPYGNQMRKHSQSVSDHVYGNIHNKTLQRQHSSPAASSVTTPPYQNVATSVFTPGSRTPNVLHSAVRSSKTVDSPQECAKIAQQIAQIHEKQRAEREAQKAKSLLNSHNIPSSNQISNMLNLHLKNKNSSQSPLIQKSSILSKQMEQELSKPYRGSGDNVQVKKPNRKYTKKTSYGATDVSISGHQKPVNKGQQQSSAIQMASETITNPSQTIRRQKCYLTTSNVIDKLKTDSTGNLNLSSKTVFTAVLPKELNQQALVKTVTNMVQNAGANTQFSQPNVQRCNTGIITTVAHSSQVQRKLVTNSSVQQELGSQSLPDHVMDFLKSPNQKEAVGTSPSSAVSGVFNNRQTTTAVASGSQNFGSKQTSTAQSKRSNSMSAGMTHIQTETTQGSYASDQYNQRQLLPKSQVYSSNSFSHSTTVNSGYSLPDMQSSISQSGLSDQLLNKMASVFTQENASSMDMAETMSGVANTNFSNIQQAVGSQSGQMPVLNIQQSRVVVPDQTSLDQTQMMNNQYLTMSQGIVDQTIPGPQRILEAQQNAINSQHVNQQHVSPAVTQINMTMQNPGIQSIYQQQNAGCQQVGNVQNAQLAPSQQIVTVNTPVNMNIVQQPIINANSANQMGMQYPPKSLDQARAQSLHRSGRPSTGQCLATSKVPKQKSTDTQELSPAILQKILSDLMKKGALKQNPNTGQLEVPDSNVSMQVNIVPKPGNDFPDSVRNSVLEATKRILQKRHAGNQPSTSMSRTTTARHNIQTDSRNPIVTNVQIPNVSILTSANSCFASPPTSNCGTNQIFGQASALAKPGVSQMINVTSSLPDLPDLGSKEFAIDSILNPDNQLDMGVSTVTYSQTHTAASPTVGYIATSAIASQNQSLPPTSSVFNTGKGSQEQPQMQKSNVSCIERLLLTANELPKSPNRSSTAAMNTKELKVNQSSVPGLQSTYLNANRLAREREDRESNNLQGKNVVELSVDMHANKSVDKTRCSQAVEGSHPVSGNKVVSLNETIDSHISEIDVNRKRNSQQESQAQTCPICHSTFATLELLKEHARNRCLPRTDELKNLKDFECNQYYFCTKCNFSNKESDIVSKHVESCMVTVPATSHTKAKLGVIYQCEMCMAKFVEKESAYKHKLCSKLKCVLNAEKCKYSAHPPTLPNPNTTVAPSVQFADGTLLTQVAKSATVSCDQGGADNSLPEPPNEELLKCHSETNNDNKEIVLSTDDKLRNRNSLLATDGRKLVKSENNRKQLSKTVPTKEFSHRYIDTDVKPDKCDNSAINRNIEIMKNVQNDAVNETVRSGDQFDGSKEAIKIENVQAKHELALGESALRQPAEKSLHCPEIKSLAVGSKGNQHGTVTKFKTDRSKITNKAKKMVASKACSTNSHKRTDRKSDIKKQTTFNKQIDKQSNELSSNHGNTSVDVVALEHESQYEKMTDGKSRELEKKQELKKEIVEVKQIDKDNELYKLYDMHLARQVRERIENEKAGRIRLEEQAERIRMEREAHYLRKQEAERIRKEKEAENVRKEKESEVTRRNEAKHAHNQKEAKHSCMDKGEQKAERIHKAKGTESACEKVFKRIHKEGDAECVHEEKKVKPIQKEKATIHKIKDENVCKENQLKSISKQIINYNKKSKHVHVINKDTEAKHRKSETHMEQKHNRMSLTRKAQPVIKNKLSGSKKSVSNHNVSRTEKARFVKLPRRHLRSTVFARRSPQATRNQKLRSLRSASLIKKRIFLIDEMEPIKTSSQQYCKVCGDKIFSRGLARHYSHAHQYGFITKGDYFKCEFCKFRCSSRSSIKLHTQRHADLIIHQVNKQNTPKTRNSLLEGNLQRLGSVTSSDESPRSAKVRKHLKAVASRSMCADRLKKISMQASKEKYIDTEGSMSDESDQSDSTIMQTRQSKHLKSPTSSISDLSTVSSARGFIATRSRSSSISSRSSVNTLSSLILQEREKRKPDEMKQVLATSLKASKTRKTTRSAISRNCYSPVSDTSSEQSYKRNGSGPNRPKRSKTRNNKQIIYLSTDTESSDSDIATRRVLTRSNWRQTAKDPDSKSQTIPYIDDSAPSNNEQFSKSTRKRARNISAASSVGSLKDRKSLNRDRSVSSDDYVDDQTTQRNVKKRKISGTSCTKDDGTVEEREAANKLNLSKLQQSPIAKRTRHSTGKVSVLAKQYVEANASDVDTSESDSKGSHQTDDVEKTLKRLYRNVPPDGINCEESVNVPLPDTDDQTQSQEIPIVHSNSDASNTTSKQLSKNIHEKENVVKVTNKSDNITNSTPKSNRLRRRSTKSDITDKTELVESQLIPKKQTNSASSNKTSKPVSKNIHVEENLVKSTNKPGDINSTPERNRLRDISAKQFYEELESDSETDSGHIKTRTLIRIDSDPDFELESEISLEQKVKPTQHNLKSCAKSGDSKLDKTSLAVMLHPDDDDEFAALKALPTANENQLESTILLDPDEEFSEFCSISNETSTNKLENADASKNLDSLKDAAMESTVLFNPADEFSDIQLSFDCRNKSSNAGLEHSKTEVKALAMTERLETSVLLSPDEEFSEFCPISNKTSTNKLENADASKNLDSLKDAAMESTVLFNPADEFSDIQLSFDCRNKSSNAGLEHSETEVKALAMTECLETSVLLSPDEEFSDFGLPSQFVECEYPKEKSNSENAEIIHVVTKSNKPMSVITVGMDDSVVDQEKPSCFASQKEAKAEYPTTAESLENSVLLSPDDEYSDLSFPNELEDCKNTYFRNQPVKETLHAPIIDGNNKSAGLSHNEGCITDESNKASLVIDVSMKSHLTEKNIGPKPCGRYDSEYFKFAENIYKNNDSSDSDSSSVTESNQPTLQNAMTMKKSDTNTTLDDNTSSHVVLSTGEQSCGFISEFQSFFSRMKNDIPNTRKKAGGKKQCKQTNEKKVPQNGAKTSELANTEFLNATQESAKPNSVPVDKLPDCRIMLHRLQSAESSVKLGDICNEKTKPATIGVIVIDSDDGTVDKPMLLDSSVPSESVCIESVVVMEDHLQHDSNTCETNSNEQETVGTPVSMIEGKHEQCLSISQSSSENRLNATLDVSARSDEKRTDIVDDTNCNDYNVQQSEHNSFEPSEVTSTMHDSQVETDVVMHVLEDIVSHTEEFFKKQQFNAQEIRDTNTIQPNTDTYCTSNQNNCFTNTKENHPAKTDLQQTENNSHEQESATLFDTSKVQSCEQQRDNTHVTNSCCSNKGLEVHELSQSVGSSEEICIIGDAHFNIVRHVLDDIVVHAVEHIEKKQNERRTKDINEIIPESVVMHQTELPRVEDHNHQNTDIEKCFCHISGEVTESSSNDCIQIQQNIVDPNETVNDKKDQLSKIPTVQNTCVDDGVSYSEDASLRIGGHNELLHIVDTEHSKIVFNKQNCDTVQMDDEQVCYDVLHNTVDAVVSNLSVTKSSENFEMKEENELTFASDNLHHVLPESDENVSSGKNTNDGENMKSKCVLLMTDQFERESVTMLRTTVAAEEFSSVMTIAGLQKDIEKETVDHNQEVGDALTEMDSSSVTMLEARKCETFNDDNTVQLNENIEMYAHEEIEISRSEDMTDFKNEHPQITDTLPYEDVNVDDTSTVVNDVCFGSSTTIKKKFDTLRGHSVELSVTCETPTLGHDSQDDDSSNDIEPLAELESYDQNDGIDSELFTNVPVRPKRFERSNSQLSDFTQDIPANELNTLSDHKAIHTSVELEVGSLDTENVCELGQTNSVIEIDNTLGNNSNVTQDDPAVTVSTSMNHKEVHISADINVSVMDNENTSEYDQTKSMIKISDLPGDCSKHVPLTLTTSNIMCDLSHDNSNSTLDQEKCVRSTLSVASKQLNADVRDTGVTHESANSSSASAKAIKSIAIDSGTDTESDDDCIAAIDLTEHDEVDEEGSMNSIDLDKHITKTFSSDASENISIDRLQISDNKVTGAFDESPDCSKMLQQSANASHVNNKHCDVTPKVLEVHHVSDESDISLSTDNACIVVDSLITPFPVVVTQLFVKDISPMAENSCVSASTAIDEGIMTQSQPQENVSSVNQSVIPGINQLECTISKGNNISVTNMPAELGKEANVIDSVTECRDLLKTEPVDKILASLESETCVDIGAESQREKQYVIKSTSGVAECANLASDDGSLSDGIQMHGLVIENQKLLNKNLNMSPEYDVIEVMEKVSGSANGSDSLSNACEMKMYKETVHVEASIPDAADISDNCEVEETELSSLADESECSTEVESVVKNQCELAEPTEAVCEIVDRKYDLDSQVAKATKQICHLDYSSIINSTENDTTSVEDLQAEHIPDPEECASLSKDQASNINEKPLENEERITDSTIDVEDSPLPDTLLRSGVMKTEQVDLSLPQDYSSSMNHKIIPVANTMKCTVSPDLNDGRTVTDTPTSYIDEHVANFNIPQTEHVLTFVSVQKTKVPPSIVLSQQPDSIIVDVENSEFMDQNCETESKPVCDHLEMKINESACLTMIESTVTDESSMQLSEYAVERPALQDRNPVLKSETEYVTEVSGIGLTTCVNVGIVGDAVTEREQLQPISDLLATPTAQEYNCIVDLSGHGESALKQHQILDTLKESAGIAIKNDIVKTDIDSLQGAEYTAVPFYKVDNIKICTLLTANKTNSESFEITDIPDVYKTVIDPLNTNEAGPKSMEVHDETVVSAVDVVEVIDNDQIHSTVALKPLDSYEIVNNMKCDMSEDEEVILISTSPIPDKKIVSTYIEHSMCFGNNQQTTTSSDGYRCSGSTSLELLESETDYNQITNREEQRTSRTDISITEKSVNTANVLPTNVAESRAKTSNVSGNKLPSDAVQTRDSDCHFQDSMPTSDSPVNAGKRLAGSHSVTSLRSTKSVQKNLTGVTKKLGAKKVASITSSEQEGLVKATSHSKNYCEEVKKLMSKSNVKKLQRLSTSVNPGKSLLRESVDTKKRDVYPGTSSTCTSSVQKVPAQTEKSSRTNKQPMTVTPEQKVHPETKTSVAENLHEVSRIVGNSSTKATSVEGVVTPKSSSISKECQTKTPTRGRSVPSNKHLKKVKCSPSSALATNDSVHADKIPCTHVDDLTYKVIHTKVTYKSDSAERGHEQIVTDEVDFKRRTENMKKALKRSRMKPYQSDFNFCDDDTESVLSSTSSTNSLESKQQRLQDFVNETNIPTVARNTSPLFMSAHTNKSPEKAHTNKSPEKAHTNKSPEKATVSRMATRLAHYSKYESPSMAQKIFAGDIVKKYSRRVFTETIKQVIVSPGGLIQDDHLLLQQVPVSCVQYPDIKTAAGKFRDDTAEDCLEVMSTTSDHSTSSAEVSIDTDTKQEMAVKLHLLRESHKDVKPFSWDEPEKAPRLQHKTQHKSKKPLSWDEQGIKAEPAHSPKNMQTDKNESRLQRQTRSGSPKKIATGAKAVKNDTEVTPNTRQSKIKVSGDGKSRYESKIITATSAKIVNKTSSGQKPRQRTLPGGQLKTGDSVMSVENSDKPTGPPRSKRNRSASSEKMDMSAAKQVKRDISNLSKSMPTKDGEPILSRTDATMDCCCSVEDLANACEKCLDEAQQLKAAKSEPYEPQVRRVIHGGKVFEIEKGNIKETDITRELAQPESVSALTGPVNDSTLPPQVESRVKTRHSAALKDTVNRELKPTVQLPQQSNTSRESRGRSASVQAVGNLNEYICATLNEIRKQRNSESKGGSKWKMPRKPIINKSKYPYSFKKSRK